MVGFDTDGWRCSYRVTLNQIEKTEDEEEQNRTLKACHQRCANRTLEVLEKNGSIFIKLGQHLVGGMTTGKLWLNSDC
jgi:predicted unusual protein kinase regulating ubiquinone biosynthesis (AarF/ABC1/UbiB family)